MAKQSKTLTAPKATQSVLASMPIEAKEELIALLERRAQMKRWRENPVLYFQERLGIRPETIDWSLIPGYAGHHWDGTPNPMKMIVDCISTGHWCVVESATGTGKTHLGALIALWFLESYEGAQVVTTAPKSEQLKLHIWKEIGKNYKAFGLGELSTLKLRMLPEREEWSAVGFVAGIKADEESTTKAQGFHAEHMLIIIEETPGVPRETITALVNTSQAEHNIVLAFGNPDSEQDNLSWLKKKSRFVPVRISSFDHPNVVLKNGSFIPGATSEFGITQLREDYPGENHPMFLSRARGISPVTNIDALISREMLDNAVKRSANHGVKALGVDVANSLNGDDASICEGNGDEALSVKSFKNKNANELGRRIEALIVANGIEPENVGIDGIGVGSGTVNTLWDNGFQVTNIISSEKAEEPTVKNESAEKFLNLRAQMWWKLRKALEKNQITIPLDEDLFEEILQVRWGIHAGKIYIESKEDIKKRLGRSTDKADSLVYWNHVREMKKKFTILFGA